MDNEVIRLLSNLVVMFDDGNLKTRFDRQTNTMQNDDEVRAWVERARKMIPAPQIDNAAQAMRNVENVDEAIAAAPNVADLRKQFAIKTAENGGALGLIRQMLEVEDAVKRNEVMHKMQTLVKVIDTNVPPGAE